MAGRILCWGELWCCVSCKKLVDAGRLPSMATRNELGAPWANPPLVFPPVSPHAAANKKLDTLALSGLASVERQCLQDWQPFHQVSQLRESVVGRGPPEKTVNLLSPLLGGRTLPEILGLQAGPSNMKFLLRLEETIDAKRCLVSPPLPKDRHPLHRDDEATKYTLPAFEQELYDLIGRPGFVEVHPPRAPTQLDWFVKNGPRVATISSLIEPDHDTSRVPPEWAALAAQGQSQVHLHMGCLIDPQNLYGPDAPGRTADLGYAGWCQSRISSLHRAGLASDPEQMFAHYAELPPIVEPTDCSPY